MDLRRLECVKRLVVLGGFGLAWALSAAGAPQLAQSPLVPEPVRDLILFTQKYNHIEPLIPGQYDGSVARLASYLLQHCHYLQHPLDNEMSERFLHRYLQLLDGAHFHFIQSDLEEFGSYGRALDDLTAPPPPRQSDTSPANLMFARLLKRVEQRVEYVAELLRSETFDFTGEDRYTPNRKGAPWPKDLDEAKRLWRQHLRYEYLQEKLARQKPEETLKTLFNCYKGLRRWLGEPDRDGVLGLYLTALCDYLQEKLARRGPEEIIKTLSNRYKRILRTLGEFDSDDILELYLTAMCQGYDPHSDYMGKSQSENFAISMKLSLFGIGALLGSEDGYCKIRELVPGGPAAKSKQLKPNDKIIAVQQAGQEPVEVVDLKLTKVVELIRGPKGTVVTLTILPADDPDPSARKTVTLVRDEIKLEDQEAKAKVVEMPDGDGRLTRLGIVDLPSFYSTMDVGPSRGKSEPKSTTADVARLLRKLMQEKISGLILDLRRNGGGVLEEAITLTGLFISAGPIVQVKDASGAVKTEYDPDPSQLYDGPLVVLTSRLSASASEILAAALQDYGRALIVGDSCTHGKGTVQTVHELNRLRIRNPFPTNYYPGALKLTIRKYYRATGSSTQLKGVTPDIVLPSVNNYVETGESAQEYALPWDTVPSTKFERLDRIQPCLDELRRRSAARQQNDMDFAYVREDIERYRKLLADKSVSLNEAQRLTEKQEAEARAKARKAERAARPEAKKQVYELTVKQADQPGLPPPLAKTNEPPAQLAGQSETKTAESAETEAEDKAPPVDVTLEEAERILLDFISLSALPPRPPAVTITN
jgi:carboxyl-terminal processing protease